MCQIKQTAIELIKDGNIKIKKTIILKFMSQF